MKSKITFILIFLFTSLKSFGQSADSIETDLARSYARARGAYLSNTLNVSQQFPQEYSSFIKKLLYYSSAKPSTISYPFNLPLQHQITILSSDDSLFRIYSWHYDDTSDWLFPCGDVLQYKWRDKTFSKSDTLEKAGVYCIQQFTLRDHGKTYYLCVYVNPVSHEVKRQSIVAFTIEDGKLINDVKIFKTDKGLTDKIDVDISVSRRIVKQKWKSESAFSFNPQILTVGFPEHIENDDQPIGHIIYKFTGQYFERVKN
ncbi:MAG TPA: hypothetical protein VK671_10160 [Mucilaginibacter sp.]|jgi:hypothetical protein|nr:hypothetical protein [Mucilaginibacter sp.]